MNYVHLLFSLLEETFVVIGPRSDGRSLRSGSKPFETDFFLKDNLEKSQKYYPACKELNLEICPI